jgi:hypothetical protein
MASFWHEFPDEVLSPVNLAEKKWALASEAFQHQSLQYARMLQGTNLEANAQVQAAKAELDAAEKNVHELWKYWVGLKSYVSKSIKLHLGCDPARCDFSTPQEVQEREEEEEEANMTEEENDA